MTVPVALIRSSVGEAALAMQARPKIATAHGRDRSMLIALARMNRDSKLEFKVSTQFVRDSWLAPPENTGVQCPL